MKFNTWLERKNNAIKNKGWDPALLHRHRKVDRANKLWKDKKEDKPIDESLFHDPEEFKKHLQSTRDEEYGKYQPHYRSRTPFGTARKGSQETGEELQRMYTNDWSRAMNTIQHFLELKGAHEGTDKYVKALDEFLDRLRRLGMKG